jgi:hypothetical protein
MRFGQTQKVHEVTVFEDGLGILVQLCHRWRHFWPTQNGAFEECTAQLPVRFTLIPPFPMGKAQGSTLSWIRGISPNSTL